MLFPPAREVDVIWRTIIKGTIKGRFGLTSKVTTNRGNRKDKRLIYIYTKDFSDKVDVRRVLNALIDVGLVRDD